MHLLFSIQLVALIGHKFYSHESAFQIQSAKLVHTRNKFLRSLDHEVDNALAIGRQSIWSGSQIESRRHMRVSNCLWMVWLRWKVQYNLSFDEHKTVSQLKRCQSWICCSSKTASLSDWLVQIFDIDHMMFHPFFLNSIRYSWQSKRCRRSKESSWSTWPLGAWYFVIPPCPRFRCHRRNPNLCQKVLSQYHDRRGRYNCMETTSQSDLQLNKRQYHHYSMN